MKASTSSSLSGLRSARRPKMVTNSRKQASSATDCGVQGTTAPRSALRARLVAAPEVADRPRTWPPVIAQVIDPAASNPGSAEQQAWRPIRVHGGPGSGKTALIVAAAVARGQR